jgi:hypothetical protein
VVALQEKKKLSKTVHLKISHSPTKKAQEKLLKIKEKRCNWSENLGSRMVPGSPIPPLVDAGRWYDVNVMILNKQM